MVDLPIYPRGSWEEDPSLLGIGMCALSNQVQCTPSNYRRISRWEHDAVVEAVEARLADHPDAMRIRRAVVEHPFGTLKAWMGSTHFLTKALDRVSAEMSLHILAYNLKRVINLV